MALQRDGKIVAAGLVEENGVNRFALARYNGDGSLDATFNGDGKATTDFGGINGSALSVAVQRDGKIVAAGYAMESGVLKFALARYDSGIN